MSTDQHGRSYETNSERQHRLKSENLWILQWFCRAALLFSIMIFLDFLLPWSESREEIVDSWYTRGRGARSMRILIGSGQKFSVYPDQFTAFRELNKDGNILVQISPIFGMVMNVVDDNHSVSVEVSMMHSLLAIIPGLMFIVSLVGVIAHRRVDLVFNAGAMSLVLIVLNLCLIILGFK